ncbi:putative cyclin-dependent kinase inhibitor 7 [Abeliophyllum distichum]|uniref:Cyclin-dependent kinase inhibitor n=1 Tax=Abeliophyllum distichum TaxID=126358 RepID=A0ABD1THP9_9LAMI
MGEYLRKCKCVKVMDGGAENRAMEVTNASSGKRRKLQSDSDQFQNHFVNFTENSVSPAISGTSDCSKDDESSNLVKENLTSSDLKSEDFETEFSTTINTICREMSPTRELCGDFEEPLMESSSESRKKPSSPANTHPIISALPSAIVPSAAELEEFFEAAEKYEQKRFAEKYNYDIVKDLPLEGKYQWVRLKP